jgi:hypothetical protein
MRKIYRPGGMAHTYNPSYQEAEIGKITNQGEPRQKSSQDSISTNGWPQ